MCLIRLWRVVRNATAAAATRYSQIRLLLKDSSAYAVGQLVVAYTTYHILKNNHLDMVPDALKTRNFKALANTAKKAAKFAVAPAAPAGAKF